MYHDQSPPDFTAIKNIATRKQAFIDYLKPVIKDINQQRSDERAELKQIYAELQAGKQPDFWQRLKLEKWSIRYGVDYQHKNLIETANQLLLRLDNIPTSMVLAQAAIESAWGTSRFVREGNNFFGQWCFVKGCGIVPNKRDKDGRHEVKKFDSAKASLLAYFRNINSHAAYQTVRQIRAGARATGKPLSGLAMIAGLTQYSGRGPAYIEELRSVIRFNTFE